MRLDCISSYGDFESCTGCIKETCPPEESFDGPATYSLSDPKTILFGPRGLRGFVRGFIGDSSGSTVPPRSDSSSRFLAWPSDNSVV